MGESFAIASVHGGRQLQFLGNIPRGLTGYDGCTFTAKLIGPDVEAAVEVYDIQPQQWSVLFRDLAKDLRGWLGEHAKESLVRHIQLACTVHLTVNVIIRVT